MVFQRAVMRRMKQHHHQQHNNTDYDDISPSKFAGTPMILGGSPNGTGGSGGGEYDVGDENSFLSKCSLLDSSVNGGQQEGGATVAAVVAAVENDGAPKTPYVVKRDPPTEGYGEASSRDGDDESLFQFAALNESLMKRDDYCPPGTTPKKKQTMGAVRIQVERSSNPTSAAAAASPSPPFTKNKSNGHNNVKSILSSMTNNKNNNSDMNVSVEVITTPQSVLHGLAITDEAVDELDEFVMATPSFKTPILTTTTTTTAAATAATTTPAAAATRAATATNNNTPPTTTTATEVVTPRMFQSSPLLTPQLGDTSLSSDMKGLSFLETEEDLVQQHPQTAKKVLNQRNSSPTSMFQSSPLNSESPNDSILMQSMSSFIVHDTSTSAGGVGGSGDGAQRELFDSINSSGEEEERKDAQRTEANLVRGRALLSIASEDETDCDDDNGGGSGGDKGDDEFENVSKLGVDFFKLSVNGSGGDKEVPAGEETTNTNTKKVMAESSFASPTGVTNFHQDEDCTSSFQSSASPPSKTSSSSLISRWLDSAFGGCGSLESIACGSKNGDDGIEESSSSSSANATTTNRQQKPWLPVTGGAPPPSSLNRPGLVQRDVSPAEELSLARQNANMTHQLYTNENKNFRVRG